MQVTAGFSRGSRRTMIFYSLIVRQLPFCLQDFKASVTRSYWSPAYVMFWLLVYWSSNRASLHWNGKGSNRFDTLNYPGLPASLSGSSISTDPNTVSPVYLIWSHEIIQSFKNIVCRRPGTKLFTKQKIFYVVFPFVTNVCEELCHFWHVGRLVYLKCDIITRYRTESWSLTSSDIVAMQRLTVLSDNGILASCFDLSSPNNSLTISVAQGKIKVSAIVCPFFALIFFSHRKQHFFKFLVSSSDFPHLILGGCQLFYLALKKNALGLSRYWGWVVCKCLISLEGLMYSLARILAQIMHCGWGRDFLLRENEIKP